MINLGRIPSLNWLRVFEAAARTNSFARAAQELNMSPPAVSQQIRSLEEHLKTSLFERGAQHVKLTSQGRNFLPTIQGALQSIETTSSALFRQKKHQRVRIQAVHLMAQSWLSDSLVDFQAHHPEIQVHLEGGNIPQDFQQPHFDLQIVFGTGPWILPEKDDLFGEVLYPVARPELAAKINGPRDLLDHQLIEIAPHQSGWFQFFEGTGMPLYSPPPKLIYADSTPAALSLAAGGTMVALARAPASNLLQKRMGLIPCFDELKIEGNEKYTLRHYGLGKLSPAARALRDWVVARATNQETYMAKYS